MAQRRQRRGRRAGRLVKLAESPVLRRRRRPGRPTWARSSASTATVARASRTSSASAMTRRSRSCSSAAQLRAGERVVARVRSRDPPRDRVQPHRHASAAGGAARAPRQPRAPGGLLRRARQAALRLQPRPGAERARSCATSRTGQRVDRRATTRCAPITTTLEEARRLGAMALFGEKYGEVVRMVEIGDGDVLARALRRHARALAPREIGAFRILSETSSAANVRRIEALTGPAAVRAAARATTELLERDRRGAAHAPPQDAPAASRPARRERRELETGGRRRRAVPADRVDLDALAARRRGDRRRARARAASRSADAKALLDAASTASRAGSATRAIVLGTARRRTRATCVASVAPALVARGVKAGAVVEPRPRSSAAAAAGATRSRRPAGAIPTSSTTRSRRRAAIAAALDAWRALEAPHARARARLRQRALRLRAQRPDRHDRDTARGRRADPPARAGSPRSRALVARARRRASWSSGCRCRCAGGETAQTARDACVRGAARATARRGRPGGAARRALHHAHGAADRRPDAARRSEDSRAAAHLLEGWLAAQSR